MKKWIADDENDQIKNISNAHFEIEAVVIIVIPYRLYYYDMLFTKFSSDSHEKCF